MCLVQLIKGNPKLNTVLAKFLYYDGTTMDDAAPATIPKPFVRLSVVPGPSPWFSAGQLKSDMLVKLELGVDGTADKAILGLWHAVRYSLAVGFPAPGDTDLTVLNVMQAAGISTFNYDKFSYEIQNQGTGQARFIYATGFLRATLLINVAPWG
jgi:hypothetical protein